jgi:hypothetical protein
VSEGSDKRPYERPVLTVSSAFGAEASSTSCCRVTGVCNSSTRNGNRGTDSLKRSTSVSS